MSFDIASEKPEGGCVGVGVGCERTVEDCGVSVRLRVARWIREGEVFLGSSGLLMEGWEGIKIHGAHLPDNLRVLSDRGEVVIRHPMNNSEELLPQAASHKRPDASPAPP